MSKDTSMVPVALFRIADLAHEMGVSNVGAMDGCWECKVDERWTLWMNGHATPTPNRAGHDVAPLSAYVEYNGWPAGSIGPNGWFVRGEAANEDTFIEALEARIVELRANNAPLRVREWPEVKK